MARPSEALGGRGRRSRRAAPERDQAERDLALGVEVEQPVHVGVDEACTTRAGSPVALATASRFARIVPASQKQWRYVRARYFQALRQNVLV